jgi:hypothetical protein
MRYTTMTKMELIKMLENVDDNAELTFVVNASDRDGYPYDKTAKVYKVLGGEVVTVRGECGITRYENLTDDLEYIEKKNLFGLEIGYYQRKKI